MRQKLYTYCICYFLMNNYLFYMQILGIIRPAHRPLSPAQPGLFRLFTSQARPSVWAVQLMQTSDPY